MTSLHGHISIGIPVTAYRTDQFVYIILQICILVASLSPKQIDFVPLNDGIFSIHRDATASLHSRGKWLLDLLKIES